MSHKIKTPYGNDFKKPERADMGLHEHLSSKFINKFINKNEVISSGRKCGKTTMMIEKYMRVLFSITAAVSKFSEMPLSEVPLHINSVDEIFAAAARWRLEHPDD